MVMTAEYVEDFRRQFVQVFPARRPLFLCPTNEAGIRVCPLPRACLLLARQACNLMMRVGGLGWVGFQKFLPTYIRPCQVPFAEMYDYEPVAQFVADFLDYLPLDEPTKFVRLHHSTTRRLDDSTTRRLTGRDRGGAVEVAKQGREAWQRESAGVCPQRLTHLVAVVWWVVGGGWWWWWF
jgi:hypothetical protein